MTFDSTGPFERAFAAPLRNGLTRPKAVRGSGTKMVNMRELFAHGRLRNVQMDRVRLSDRESNAFLLKRGDLLFARQSLVLAGAGKCVLFLGDDEPVTFESHIIRARLDAAKADPAFFYYFFNSRSGRNAIESIVEQVAAAGVRSSDLARLAVPQIPVTDQRAIAQILGALDDKIDLNRQMNETLETMAHALFKSWFVEFDPVRAKAEGRAASLPMEIASLFPSAFQDSEVGVIPKGWHVGKIGELLELAYGSALTASSRRPGNVAVYGSNGQVGWHDEPLVEGPGVVVGRKGNPGTVVWAPTDFFPIDTVFYVVPRSRSCSLPFLFHALRQQELGSLAADSAVPGLNRNIAYMSTQVVPPQELIESFGNRVSPLASRVHLGVENSRTLAALRDTLLPKLLSGQLRIPDAEALVARHT